MTDSYVTGYTVSQFSTDTLDLQAKTFCCGGIADNKKFLKFIKNTPVVYQNSNTILSSAEADLTYWQQEIESSNVESIRVLAGATTSVLMNSNFLFVKVVWPSDSAASSKVLELGIPSQSDVIGSTIGNLDLINYVLIKDLYIINSSVSLVGNLLINNATSVHDITIHIIKAI
jgi:hypothetical protein